ncbi:DNA polymerase V [Chitinophaga sp. YR573]|uniref:Y-family DNA polymerase n=1 Tax=Chitinophaga sp. YR573 TaxID=1881040 RepID=UPI0008B7E835|nr:Y-family DNA polymerase [Chitinophaga sp. YR573]SEW21143.1 DNA polymerase V [Chitinophaga sp. YR573]
MTAQTFVALIDCNNYYASAERLFNPSIRRKAVAVLSNNDGCIVSRSEETKALGIPMGAPIHKFKALLTANDVAIFSSNYTLYNSISDRVHKTISQFVEDVEKYSIDEAFVSLDGFTHVSLYRHCRLIRATVLRNVGIPVCIGIAPTRTLAKLANWYAKKERRQIGVYILDSQEKINALLKWTKVEDIWGIGRKYAHLLNKYRIYTAWDLVHTPKDWIKKHLSVVGLRLVMELQGTICAELETEPAIRKCIGTAKSFGTPLSRRSDVGQALANYTALVAEKIRSQKSAAGQIHVFLQTNPFNTSDKQYYQSVTINLPVATSSTVELLYYADHALNRIWKQGYNFKKVGIQLQQLVDENKIQYGLYDQINREKQNNLMLAIDQINSAFGKKDIVKFARQGNTTSWKMKQEHLSPCYTTKLSDVLIIRA